MAQVASCEQALIKTNRKPIQNHHNKTLLVFKQFTLEFEFGRHLEHMFSYHGIQSGLPVFIVGEFGTVVIFFCKDACLAKPDFSFFSNCKHKDHIWAEYNHVLPFTNPKSALLRFWLIYKFRT